MRDYLAITDLLCNDHEIYFDEISYIKKIQVLFPDSRDQLPFFELTVQFPDHVEVWNCQSLSCCSDDSDESTDSNDAFY